MNKSHAILWLLLVMLMLTVGLHAQDVVYRGNIGLNIANTYFADDQQPFSENHKPLLGIHAGLSAEIPLAGPLSFDPGLRLSMKGYVLDDIVNPEGTAVEEYKERWSIFFLDLPMQFRLAARLSQDVHLIANFGPYAGLSLFGQMETSETDNGQSTSEERDIKFGSRPGIDDLERFDYGLMAGLGIDVYRYQLLVFYEYGLADWTPVTANNNLMQNRMVGISLYYRLAQ